VWRGQLFAGAMGNKYVLLLAVIVVVAPFNEEFIFRGIFLAGRRRRAAAVVFAAAAWALAHWQYDWPALAELFAVGLYLGAARYRFRSLWLCVLLHAGNNLIAMM
jgi:membrane protease YdiL (CAAX protease family)